MQEGKSRGVSNSREFFQHCLPSAAAHTLQCSQTPNNICQCIWLLPNSFRKACSFLLKKPASFIYVKADWTSPLTFKFWKKLGSIIVLPSNPLFYIMSWAQSEAQSPPRPPKTCEITPTLCHHRLLSPNPLPSLIYIATWFSKPHTCTSMLCCLHTSPVERPNVSIILMETL